MKAPAAEDSFDDVPLTALLREGQRTYADSIERAFGRSGHADLPLGGSYLLTAMAWTGASLEEVLRWMGVSKQVVSQSVDSLVVRGYLRRTRDPADGRRVILELTARGTAAAKVARSAIVRTDEALRRSIGADDIQAARTAMVALIRLRA